MKIEKRKIALYSAVVRFKCQCFPLNMSDECPVCRADMSGDEEEKIFDFMADEENRDFFIKTLKINKPKTWKEIFELEETIKG